MDRRAEHAITAQKLTKTFGDFTAVDAISFEVKKRRNLRFFGCQRGW
jgi:ABC-type uncharacterized transport system ATPase subunit